jgi:hypothetical protein
MMDVGFRWVRNWIICVLGVMLFRLGTIPAKANFLSYLIKKNEDAASVEKKSKTGPLRIVVKPRRQVSVALDKTAHLVKKNEDAASVEKKSETGHAKIVVNTEHQMSIDSTTHTDELFTNFMESENEFVQNSSTSSATVSMVSKEMKASFAQFMEESEEVPLGYEIKDVPGDGLCGYWAVLVAVAAAKNAQSGKNTSIHISKKDVFDLLKRLSDRIMYTICKEDKTDDEQSRVGEINQLICDGYGNDCKALCRKIEAGFMQLDSPLLVFLALEIGYDIWVNWRGRMQNGETKFKRERYASGCANAEIVRVIYSGNGSFGHYRAIIPKGINVCFN